MIFKYFEKKRIRAMMRGYRYLKKSNKLYFLEDLRRELVNNKFDIKKKKYSEAIFGAALPKAELVIRQYLSLIIPYTYLNKILLICLSNPDNKKVRVAIPQEWCKILKNKGFKVSEVICRVLWFFFLLKLYLFGIIRIFQIIINSFPINFFQKLTIKNYSYFSKLSENNLPIIINNRKSYDVISWYWDKYKTRNHDNINQIYTSVKSKFYKNLKKNHIFFQKSIFPRFFRFKPFFKYLFWSLKVSTSTLIDLLLNRWWNVIMLNEAVFRIQANLLEKQHLAREYLFSNSEVIYRPLWTYEAEEKGSKVILYFYSINYENFLNPKKIIPVYLLMNWPHYLVWNKRQADFILLNTINSDPTVEIVGPIWFSDSPVSIPRFKEKIVAVFDVIPYRESIIRSYCFETDYYNFLNISYFWKEICKLSKDKKIKFVLKSKREINCTHSKNYFNLLNNISKKDNIYLLNSNLSPYHIIKASDRVICYPFTSVALMANELNKQTIYFDPTKLIKKNSPCANNIPILHDIKELELWLNE